METENINHEFLDGVLEGHHPDVYYHFGVSSEDAILDPLREVKAIVMAGSGGRIKEFADFWSAANGDSPIVAFPKEDRFVTRYTAGVLFASHGMGMPSASIALQELMRMAFFLKDGDLDALDEVFWARVGTSGGVGLPGGTVVLSSEGLMADLRPFRLLRGLSGEYWFDGAFPEATRQAILDANADAGIPLETGKTVAGNEFFLEQYRLDGALRLESHETKMTWLQWLYDSGVRNIEMEGAMIAGYLNHWGFSKFAMICTTLLNRLEGDQVTASPEELHRYSEDSGVVLFNYLKSSLLPADGE
ncbi:MAG: uridine phosphorylase [Actinobacteria bacterium]|nr:uridine phosphorylase [Actinomycetota bacterium]MCB9413473.1 uridine phosphorylase [Actinomycetota bacterium]